MHFSFELAVLCFLAERSPMVGCRLPHFESSFQQFDLPKVRKMGSGEECRGSEKVGEKGGMDWGRAGRRVPAGWIEDKRDKDLESLALCFNLIIT
jgi:hypothetical protein